MALCGWAIRVLPWTPSSTLLSKGEEIVSHYPVLRLADVYAVIAYYLNNQATVENCLRQQREEAQKTWEQIEAKSDYQTFRERLLARHQGKTRPAEQ